MKILHFDSAAKMTSLKDIEFYLRLDKIEDSLSDYNFFKRNPKLSLGIIVVSVLIVLFSYIEIKNIYSNGAAIHENGLKIEAKK